MKIEITRLIKCLGEERASNKSAYRGHVVLDLVDELALLGDQQSHVDKEAVQLFDGGLEADQVVVPVLDVRKGVLGGLQGGSGEKGRGKSADDSQ